MVQRFRNWRGYIKFSLPLLVDMPQGQRRPGKCLLQSSIFRHF